MATKLEDSFHELLAAHDLRSLSVGARKRGGFSCIVHWDGFARSGNSCEIGNGKSIQEAIARAVTAAAKCRTPPAEQDGLADEALPSIAA